MLVSRFIVIEFFGLFFGPHHMACGILVPTSSALEKQSLNHWTAKEVPIVIEFCTLLNSQFFIFSIDFYGFYGWTITMNIGNHKVYVFSHICIIFSYIIVLARTSRANTSFIATFV